jgi:hypothetical protein
MANKVARQKHIDYKQSRVLKIGALSDPFIDLQEQYEDVQKIINTLCLEDDLRQQCWIALLEQPTKLLTSTEIRDICNSTSTKYRKDNNNHLYKERSIDAPISSASDKQGFTLASTLPIADPTLTPEEYAVVDDSNGIIHANYKGTTRTKGRRMSIDVDKVIIEKLDAIYPGLSHNQAIYKLLNLPVPIIKYTKSQWAAFEDDILKSVYPRYGAAGVQLQISKPYNAIVTRAHHLGIRKQRFTSDSDDYKTVSEVASLFKVSRANILIWTQKGYLKHVQQKINGQQHYLYLRKDLMEFIHDNPFKANYTSLPSDYQVGLPQMTNAYQDVKSLSKSLAIPSNTIAFHTKSGKIRIKRGYNKQLYVHTQDATNYFSHIKHCGHKNPYRIIFYQDKTHYVQPESNGIISLVCRPLSKNLSSTVHKYQKNSHPPTCEKCQAIYFKHILKGAPPD